MKRLPLTVILCSLGVGLGAAVEAGEPDRVGPAAPGQINRSPLKVKVSDVGIQLLPQPIDLGGGVRYLGTGPNPSEIRARITCNLNAADTTNADQLWPGGGLGLSLSGAGLTAGVWDAGAVRSTHQELTGRVTVVDAVGLQDHSTHVAGTIGATGASPSAHGMADGILIRSRDWNNDMSELGSDAGAGLIQISSHSYGFVSGWTNQLDWGIGFTDTWLADRAVYAVESPNFGKYDSNTRSLDIVLNSNPDLLTCWAAGNDRGDAYGNAHGDNTYVAYFSTPPVGGTSVGSGYYQVPNSGATSAPPSDGNPSGYDSISGLELAKNCVTVGAIDDQAADPYSSMSIASFSGNGPVDDGRVKPDVVGNGVALTSCVTASDTAYSSFSGTSMATPNIAGTSALIIEHYKNLNSGALPRSTTTKALLIHNAFDGGTTGPDYRYGWGLVDAAKTVFFLNDSESATPSSNYLYEATYTGTTQDYIFTYGGSGTFKATLVWNDPAPSVLPGAGVDVTTPVLVRDLDLSIIGPPGSTTYWPWTLDSANPTAAAVRTTRNSVDNVEQVLIDTPSAGNYTVRVSHTGTAASQNYSLLVSAGTNLQPNPMTFASAPAAVGTTSIGMTATTATGGTPPMQYMFQCTSATPGGTSSFWQVGTGYIDTGLQANSPYAYGVAARDSNTPTPNQSAFSPDHNVATAIETPLGLATGVVGVDFIDLVAQGTFSNLSAGQSGLYFDSLTPGGDTGLNVWVQGTTATATGLTPDTDYEFVVKARNRDGVETVLTDPASFHTFWVAGDCNNDQVFSVESDLDCIVDALLGNETSPPNGAHRIDLNYNEITDGEDIQFIVDCLQFGGC